MIRNDYFRQYTSFIWLSGIWIATFFICCAAVDNLAAAGGANLPPAAQQAAATGFALTPGLAVGNNLINFNTKDGLLLYKAGIEPLMTAFDLKE